MRAGSCAESAGPAGEAQVDRRSTPERTRACLLLFLWPHGSDSIPRFATAEVSVPPVATGSWRSLGCSCSCSSCYPSCSGAQISSQALREILRAEMTRVSDSVYVLQISPVRLRLFPGSISFDSAYVTTDTIRKAALPQPPGAAAWCTRLPVQWRRHLEAPPQAGALRFALPLQRRPHRGPRRIDRLIETAAASPPKRKGLGLPEAAAGIQAARGAPGHQHRAGGRSPTSVST